MRLRSDWGSGCRTRAQTPGILQAASAMLRPPMAPRRSLAATNRLAKNRIARSHGSIKSRLEPSVARKVQLSLGQQSIVAICAYRFSAERNTLRLTKRWRLCGNDVR